MMILSSTLVTPAGREVMIGCNSDEQALIEAEKHKKECVVCPGGGTLERIMRYESGRYFIGWFHANYSSDGKLMCATSFIYSPPAGGK
jgi:hypothetical protein